jgi:hypothetical protein
MLHHRLKIASLCQTMVIRLFASPNATYGDVMSFDRAFREAESEVAFLAPQYKDGELVPMSDPNMDLQRAFTLAPTALAHVRVSPCARCAWERGMC